MRKLILLILSAFAATGSTAQTGPTGAMSDFMGINTNVAAYDNKFLTDLSKCVKWIREYHDWAHYEAANNYYKWDNITTQPQGYTWPEHTEFMKECRRLGMQVLIDVLGKPSWAGSSPIPLNSGNGTQATDYIERLEFLGQLVARYGSQKIDASLLETADKLTGLGWITYYEDDNEPDYTWKSPLWPAVSYAKYCNAAHDGYGIEPDAGHPLLGIKSVDPNARHVMAGLASPDTIYLSNVLKASAGRIPFDVLNLHWYCSDLSNAYAPEHEKYGYEKSFEKFFKWRNRHVPQTPVWITEFGWDTYLAATGQHSYTYAPAQQQANYLLRSYLILRKLGFGKAFLFMDTDSDSKNTLQYATSGLLTDKISKYTKKTSWYYLATMQNVLGKLEYARSVSFKETVGENEVYCIEFVNPQNQDKTYALWARKTGSKTDSGVQMHYDFVSEVNPAGAFSILPANLDTDGDTLVPSVDGNSIGLTLSETPQFLVIPEKNTGVGFRDSKKPELKIFPNPAGREVSISISLKQSENAELQVYSADGRLVETLNDGEIDSGTHRYSFGRDHDPGAYLVRLRTSQSSVSGKIMLLGAP